MLGDAVDFLVDNSLLPLTSIIIEPAKVLFLNNAINHGVLTPLGIDQAAENGKSILFLLEANPGPGLGLLLAFMFFGKGIAKARPPARDHPLLRRHPRDLLPLRADEAELILAMIAGGMTGRSRSTSSSTPACVAPAAPGSIIAVYAQTARRQLPRGHPVGHRAAPRSTSSSPRSS